MLSCFPTIFTNLTTFKWNDFDNKSFKIAQTRCGEIYKGNPCVKEFIKSGKFDYKVVCTKEKLI